MEALLEARDVTKVYGETKTRALDRVNFKLMPAEIHGLVGANGSGKSTLLNILSGSAVIHQTGGFNGELYMDGQAVLIQSPLDCKQLGIGMVHQELSLIGDMNVAANIRLNHESAFEITERLFGWNGAYVDEKETRRVASAALGRLNQSIRPEQQTNSLSVNLKQFVEIAREISRELKVLILDEPTACLGPEDASNLMKLLLELKEEGMSIILVSHRLEELVDCCDRITVFRDGHVAAALSQPDFDLETIAHHMLGSAVEKANRTERHSGHALGLHLELRNFVCRGPNQIQTSLSLDIRKGEILGFTGLAGHGHNLLPYALMNLMSWQGEVRLNGTTVSNGDSSGLIRQGIFFLPDERKELGLLLDESIAENIVFTAFHALRKFAHKTWILWMDLPDREAIKTYAEVCVERLGIKCHSIKQLVGQLSGGNQQKVCIARALAVQPALLFVGEPTRGMDIHAKEKVLEQLLDLNKDYGTTLVVSSSELDELQRICDRIAVFHEGRLFKLFEAGASTHELLQAMIGKEVDQDAKN